VTAEPERLPEDCDAGTCPCRHGQRVTVAEARSLRLTRIDGRGNPLTGPENVLLAGHRRNPTPPEEKDTDTAENGEIR